MVPYPKGPMKRTVVSSRIGWGSCLAGLFFAASPACTEDPTKNSERACHSDCEGGDGGETGTGGSELPATAQPGLDKRPRNASCRAWLPPPASGDGAFVRAFPELQLNAPMHLAQAPGDTERLYVIEREGRMVSFPIDAAVPDNTATVLTIPKPVNTLGEGGLLGFAFHPDFASNGEVYLSFTTTGGGTGMRSVIARMISNDGGLSFPADSYEVILGPFEQPWTNHNGGDLHFGLDGYLYASFGDGGSGGDPLGNGQRKTGFLSKLLRMDVDTSTAETAYGIPVDNPFADGDDAGDDAEPATYAYGLRNPFRFSIDRGTGIPWVGDVGQNLWEEVDKILPGGNYGWNTREGRHCYEPSQNCATEGLVDPVWEYDRSQGNSITGGVVYRGQLIPALQGAYVVGDFGSGRVWALKEKADGSWDESELDNGGGSMWVAFGEDNAANVYGLSITGAIYSLVGVNAEAEDVGVPSAPLLLSETGCLTAEDPTQPTEGLIPYTPRAELWSDGAQKDRWMAMPDAAKIAVDADGDFELPSGSVLVKSFRLEGVPVETRLWMRDETGRWSGYSYAWDEDGKDAHLLNAGETRQWQLPSGQSQAWVYPSRAECGRCHTAAAGYSLGLELAQLDHAVLYPATGRTANQLQTLEAIDLLTGEPVATTALPRMVDPFPGEASDCTAPCATTEELTQQARSYLHANCSFCHRPEGGGGGVLDLRWSQSLAATNSCGSKPQAGDLGHANALVITPGNPDQSILLDRVFRRDVFGMPPLASKQVDLAGHALLKNWISSLSTCPD
jgi:uncharacterized repeat protein (TIGR03806 family)